MRVTGSCLIAICCLLTPVAAAVEDDAARAFAAGDHPRALELYERLLGEQPDNEQALMRAGKLFSWDKRFDEALERYDRLLTLRPHDRDVSLEQAKVLSWAGRYDEAIDAFTAYLARHPQDTTARRSLARCLSWNGDHDGARAAFRRLLEDEPDDAEAMVGIGRTHAWTGNHVAARKWYERALEKQPDHVDARVGLSYLELWSGDPARADRMAAELASEHPDVPDVVELQQRTRRARGPWIRSEASRLDDTDDNKLNIYGLRGGVGLAGGVDLSLGVTRYDMSDNTGDARIDNITAEAAFRPGRGQLLTLTVGYDDRERTDGSSESDTLGGVHWLWGRHRPWQVRASAQRNAVRYNPTITDNGILIDDLALSVNGRVAPRWRVHAGAAQGDYSDDNDRFQATAGFSRELTSRRSLRLSTGLGLRFTDFDADTDSGYFDPQDFTSALANLRGNGEIGSRQRYRFALDAGAQSFTLGGVDTDGDTVVIVSGAWIFVLGHGLELELFGEWGDYAGASAAGFESRQGGLRLVWRPGGMQ